MVRAPFTPARYGVDFMRRREFLGVSAGLAGSLAGCRRTDDVPGGSTASAQPATEGREARILGVVPAVQKREGQGAIVGRIFPSTHLRDLDPFVLLDDFNVREPAGFPRHPHRGFEAFTYMLEGAFHHQDNLGNDSVVGAGGTQRFTSGRGAYHSEMPATASDNRGLQLWVNLPKAQKNMDPSYAPTDPLDIPEASERGLWQRTVVGDASPVTLETAVDYLDLSLERGARFERVLSAGWNGLVYVIEGHVRLLGQALGAGNAALPSPGIVHLAALEPSRVLYLAGRPHGQPIIHNGPFVD